MAEQTVDVNITVEPYKHDRSKWVCVVYTDGKAIKRSPPGTRREAYAHAGWLSQVAHGLAELAKEPVGKPS